MQLLHIDSSVLGAHSASRVLSAAIVARLVALHPGLKVTYHDLGANALPHLSPADVPELAKGNAYIDELFAADVVVIGAPMYNFSVPTQLKAWIDRVTVAGKTFRYGANGPEGLVLNKKLFIASARGGVYSPGSPAAGVEHQESYLRAVLGFLGLTDVTVVRAEGLAMGPEAREAAMSKAHEAIAALTA